jgi:GMP synthase (glutamine-hydrolysing)
MRVHYVMHASFEVPGFIDQWAEAQGHLYSGTHVYEGQPLPDPGDVDFLIVMGGPQSPLRLDAFPYLRDEINLVAKVISHKKPVIGFCLGSQLIAEALGAQTCRSPEKEVGIFPVHSTLAGTKDPILRGFPAEFDALHWHHDMPGIPDGAVLLARSAGCPHQAFRFGDRVYGFQFHMEPTAESIKPLLQNGESDLAPSRYTQTAAAILSSDFGSMNARLAQVLDALAAFAPRRDGIR